MKQRILFPGLFLLLLFIVTGPLLISQGGQPEGIARGKSAALPLAEGTGPEQELAQNLALADGRVQAHTAGRRSEVFGVRAVLAVGRAGAKDQRQAGAQAGNQE